MEFKTHIYKLPETAGFPYGQLFAFVDKTGYMVVRRVFFNDDFKPVRNHDLEYGRSYHKQGWTGTWIRAELKFLRETWSMTEIAK